uniref:EZH inhibitory protein n=1 Tax=Rhinolophus ferrumequinum TaxID=59479 RepID=A0A671E084_RHIFE
MATPSCWEKELKQQEGEVPAGPNNEVTPAPGDARGTGNRVPTGTWIPTVSSDRSLSGGGAPRVVTAGASSCAVAAPGAILIVAEDPGPPSMDCVQSRGRPEHPGSPSPHAELRCVRPETAPAASADARGQATSGAGQAGGRPTQTRSPAKGRGRKRPGGEEAVGAPKLPEPEGSAPLPPSSPTAQPSSRRCRPAPRASPCSRASQPGPALGSQALLSAPGSVLPSEAAMPGPVLRSRTTLPGPASCRRRRAPAPGPAPLRDESGPGPALCSLGSAPGPQARRRATAPGPAIRRHRAPEPGPARRHALGCAASDSALRSGGTTPAFVRLSRPSQRGSLPTSRPSLPAPVGQSPPSPGSALGRLVFPSNSGVPDPEVPSLPSQPGWHAVRMRASSPSPPGRYFPFPEQFGESSSPSPSSSSSSPSPSSSPTNFSGQSSSSPKFCGLGSISTPSPASLRRAFLPEVDALTPISPGEQAEVGSIPSPPTPPVL